MIAAFSAAFLGSTQFRGGRCNSWGTIVAVLLLATGSYGLLLSGVGQWAPQVFQGVVLIAAVGVSVARTRRRPRRMQEKPKKHDTGSAGGDVVTAEIDPYAINQTTVHVTR